MKTFTIPFLLLFCTSILANGPTKKEPTAFEGGSLNPGRGIASTQGGFGGGGFGGGGFGQGGFGGGGFGGGGFGGGGFGGGGAGRGGGSGKEAAKSIETFGTKTSEGITKAGENFQKSIADSSKNNLDFNKLTPDLNGQVSDGLKNVNDGIAKQNELFKSDGERKSIGEATVDQNIEAIRANAKTQMEIDAAIASRYTANNGITPQASNVSNLSKISGAVGNYRNADPIANAMGAQAAGSSDPNHSEGRGFTRGVPYKSPFAGSGSH